MHVSKPKESILNTCYDVLFHNTVNLICHETYITGFFLFHNFQPVVTFIKVLTHWYWGAIICMFCYTFSDLSRWNSNPAVTILLINGVSY